MKLNLINSIADGRTGRGRGCTPTIVFDYQCATQANGMNGTITLVVNREYTSRGVRACVNAFNEALQANGLDDYFVAPRQGNAVQTEDQFTIVATFDLAGYMDMVEAA